MQRGRMLSWFVVWSVAALCCVTLHGVEAMTLKIMTYNIHHGADVRDRVDLERVVQTLRVHVPDVVFLSEVDQYWYRSGLVDQPAVLSQAAGMPFHHYAPALVTSSFAVTLPGRQARYGNLFLSVRPLFHASSAPLPRLGNNEPRNVLWVDLPFHGGLLIRIYGTHLSVDAKERSEQLSALGQLLAASPHPAIVVGDFNSPPDRLKHEAPYLWSSPWHDAHTLIGTGPGFTFPTPAPTSRIDYIFVHETLLPYLRSIATPYSPASDHLPVIVELSVDPSAD